MNNKKKKKLRIYAWIDEKNCIGCNKCLKKCPNNAIVGSRGFLHTIINKNCIGCTLCISQCPTKCIDMYTKI
ncbi:RnfABCDGE type electron transport complex subunit B [Candidatus Annandia adelgestsuga]|uniref:RnfABCDGE type electron transport complex subunit B n=1 Tax=Candidatus Annandia adelgestsuga TaxID=1302411 RepID=UPI000F7F0DAC|nr:RnfABCDGE type electron transport complex subunit B [Candidatus Annandia adelgestsuga]